MNLIGACRFVAACVKLRTAKALALAYLSCVLLVAADCNDQGLSAQEKISRFKELDKEAETAMQQQRASEAVQLYQQAVCLVPNSARGYYGLGVAEAAVGNFLKAREDLQTADRLQPTTAMPLIMQIRVNFSLSDLDALKANLREVALRFPRDTQVHDVLARFLAEKNLFALALAEALRSKQAGGGDLLGSKVQLAVLENTVGAYEDAIRNAVAVEEDHNVAREVRASAAGVAGLSYESLGQADQAIRYLKEAIELDPSRDNSYLALADLFDQSQKYADAVAVLKQARLVIPNSTAVLLPLGIDLVRAEHYKMGIEVLRELLQQAPDAAEAYISIADASRKMGNPKQEAQALRDLALHKPDYPAIHMLIARAMLSDEPIDYAKVLEELSLAEIKAPLESEIFYLRGKVYVALGRYEDALVPLSRSIELRPMEAGPYYQLARVYQKLGRLEIAREQFERVKHLESASPK
jgi:tetratricopeptide (TPR) repeat protein